MNFLINGPFIGLAKLQEITGGHSILDMEFTGYSVEKAYNILEALGEEGRAFDMKYIVPLDFPFPLSYGLFYFVSLTFIAKKMFKNLKKPWLFGIIGGFATLFDWLENLMIINLLQNYPKRLNGAASIASVFTQLKGLFIASTMGLIVIGLLALVIKAFYVKVIAKVN
jgi:hypothetical protein